MQRLPRNLKKKLKAKYKHRYGCNWLKSCNLMIEYKWFFHNPNGWDMNVKLDE